MRGFESDKRQSLQHARGYQDQRTLADLFARLGMTLHVSEMNAVCNAARCGGVLEVTTSLSSSDYDQIGFNAAGAQLGERRDGNVEALVVVKTSDADQAMEG